MTFQNWRLMSIATFVCLLCAVQAYHQRNLGDLGFAMDVIEHSYVDKVDRYRLYQAAMKGMIKELDQYSGYVSPDEFGAFHTQIHQEFGGLGIVIERPDEKGALRIFSVIYDSPAFKAGLQPGDVIELIDGQSSIGISTEKASAMLRGEPGTVVKLSIRRDTATELSEFDVRRAIIETESVTGDRRNSDGRWNFLMQADPRIAYLRVEIFGEKTPSEFRKALQAVKPEAKGLIVDLRDNSGGLLPTATDLCDMFLEKGTIVSTKGRRPSYSSEHNAEPGVEIADNVPIVVLINGQSASASEVTAACLQDLHRAVIIGQRSFGKGSVQNVIDLEGGKAALRVTSAFYFPPSGRNIHRRLRADDKDEWGVLPDPGFEIVLDEEQTKKAFERLRNRGNPLAKEAASQSDDTSVLKAGTRDPSVKDDPQLLRAVEFLESKFADK
jgi:carboxyl-terminal processing protease